MNKLVTSVHVLLWLTVASFVMGSLAYGFYVRRVSNDVIWCGNALTDPLWFLLSCGAPAAGLAATCLAILLVYDRVRPWSPLTAGALSGATVAGLLLYGRWLFSTMLPGHPLSEIVWWLRPVWEAF